MVEKRLSEKIINHVIGKENAVDKLSLSDIFLESSIGGLYRIASVV